MLPYAEPPFPLNETYKGKDSDGNLVNQEMLGKIYFHPVKGSTDSAGRPVGRPVKAMIVRNESGVALLGKRVAKLTATAGYAGLTSIDGYATVLATGRHAFLPNLPSAGVADDDLCWVVLEGPTTVLTAIDGADFNGAITAGNPLVNATGTTTQATTSGRISNVTFVVATDGNSSVGLRATSLCLNVLGVALSTRTTSETATDLLVHATIRW
jgi:hypothetical protein